MESDTLRPTPKAFFRARIASISLFRFAKKYRVHREVNISRLPKASISLFCASKKTSVSSSSVAKDLGAVITLSKVRFFAPLRMTVDRKCKRTLWLPLGDSVFLLHFAVCVNAVLRPTPKTLHSRISSVSDGFHHGVISSTFGGFHFAFGLTLASILTRTYFPFSS